MHTHFSIMACFTLVLMAPPAQAGDPAQIFSQRIEPIFRSPQPSSCVQCHLASVDLKDYILPSSTATFLALREQGLIDLEKPENSKILRLIKRGAGNPRTVGLIPAQLRQAEYEAFAAWIKACAADPKLRTAAKPAQPPTLALKPVEVVRHARKDRLLESFETNIWTLRFRCMNCHTEGTPQNNKLRKEYGDRVAWFKKDGPAATMEYLLTSKLIDTTTPDKSLLLTKPLGEVKHGGGIKFALGDQGYKAMRLWLEDVAAIKNAKYTKAADLPREATGVKQFGSELWFKLINTPHTWADKLLQVDLYRWDEAQGKWETEPVATSDRLVGSKGNLWQHTLTLRAPIGSERAKSWSTRKPLLPSGKYRVSVYVDQGEKMKRDWKVKLGSDDFVGQAEFKVSHWKEGYGAMTVVDAKQLKK